MDETRLLYKLYLLQNQRGEGQCDEVLHQGAERQAGEPAPGAAVPGEAAGLPPQGQTPHPRPLQGLGRK